MSAPSPAAAQQARSDLWNLVSPRSGSSRVSTPRGSTPRPVAAASSVVPPVPPLALPGANGQQTAPSFPVVVEVRQTAAAASPAPAVATRSRGRPKRWFPTWAAVRRFGSQVVVAGGLLAVTPWAPTLLRGVAAFVGLTEEVSAAAGALVRAGTNATLVATDVALVVSRAAVSLLREAWTGVDLTDVRANVSAARWLQARGISAAELAASPVGFHIRSLPMQWRSLLLDSVFGVSELVPTMKSSFRQFVAEGRYEEFDYEVKLWASGHVGVQFFWGSVLYAVRWANPLWHVFQADAKAALAPLCDAVHDALQQATRVLWRGEPLPRPADLELPVPPAWYIPRVLSFPMIFLAGTRGNGADLFAQSAQSPPPLNGAVVRGIGAPLNNGSSSFPGDRPWAPAQA